MLCLITNVPIKNKVKLMNKNEVSTTTNDGYYQSQALHNYFMCFYE